MRQILPFLIAFLCFNTSFAITPITGPTSVCTGDTIVLSEATSGGTWTSSNVSIATVGSTGLVAGVAMGTATISYVTGSGTATLTITINPTPHLSSTTTPSAICDSTIFSYTPTSGVSGASFAWSRAAIPGINGGSGASGTGNPLEAMVNATDLPIAATYVYTITASGCSAVENVTVSVNPTPRLSSSLSLPPMCDTLYFIYSPSSHTPGVLFSWSRPTTAGISPPSAFGTGDIDEYLTDVGGAPDTVTYFFILGFNGCINHYPQTVTVIVDTNCSRSAVRNVTSTNESLIVSPNPSSDQIVVSGCGNATCLSVINGLGQVVCTKTNNINTEEHIDVSYLPDGVYFVRVAAPNGVKSAVFIKR